MDLLAWPGDRAGALDAVLLGAANGAIVVDVAMLFVGSRRPPHDRIAGTVVAEAAGSAGGDQQGG